MSKRTKMIRIISLVLAASMLVGIFSVIMWQILPFLILIGVIIYLVYRFNYKKKSKY